MSELEPCGDVGGVGGVLLTHFLRSPYQNWKGMLNVHMGISLGQQANRAYCSPPAPHVSDQRSGSLQRGGVW